MAIKSLSIKRFKSIKSLEIPCRKVNLFIGAPDTGKTNILDALSFQSAVGWNLSVDHHMRLSPELGFEPLFFRQFLNERIEIAAGEFLLSAGIQGQERKLDVELRSPGGGWAGTLGSGARVDIPTLRTIRFYTYGGSERWQYATGWPEGEKLVTPPWGQNLIYIARHNAKVYEFLKETISALNWKLRFDAGQKKLRLSEVRKDDIFDYNLDLLSDSLKRLIFYGSILLTTENAILVFDEPDVYAFPPYPKTLGEMIASDESNQFFLTTHNPYFLAGVVQKVPVSDMALFVCHRDPEGGTGAKLLSEGELQSVVEQGPDVFFNLEDFIKA